MNKVKPLKLTLETARDQATYYFNREFESTDFQLISESKIEYGICDPSDKSILNNFINETSFDIESYKNELIDEGYDEDDIIEKLIELQEFESWKDDYFMNHYPMWSAVFRCSRFYIDSTFMDVDKLYQLGIGALEHNGNYCLFIAGAGYDFYEAHWIPLFKELGWIKDE